SFSVIRLLPLRSLPFPYTTLFRSEGQGLRQAEMGEKPGQAENQDPGQGARSGQRDVAIPAGGEKAESGLHRRQPEEDGHDRGDPGEGLGDKGRRREGHRAEKGGDEPRRERRERSGPRDDENPEEADERRERACRREPFLEEQRRGQRDHYRCRELEREELRERNQGERVEPEVLAG